MHWAKEQRAQHLQSKLEIDDSRAAAFKEVQEQQRRAIAAIQKQVNMIGATRSTCQWPQSLLMFQQLALCAY